MQKYFNTVANRSGAAVSNATVTVKTQAGAFADLYADNGVTTKANPVRTDSNGYFEFYAADGRYNLTIAGAGIGSQTINDVLLEDPADGGGAGGFFAPLSLLGGGAASHSDGTNVITGSARLFLGNGTPSADDSALLIGRSLAGSYSTGAHAVRDETAYNASGGGLAGYASFDAIPTLSGALHYNHLRAFQARPQYAGSGGIDELAGATVQNNHTGSGTVGSNYGLKISNPQGSGPITNNYAIWIDPQTRGGSNYAIYSGSATLPSYHGGTWQTGGDIIAAGKGKFTGAINGAAIDSAGTPDFYGTNGGLGLYGYASNAYARIQAYSNGSGTGKNLSINSAGGKVLIGTTVENGSDALQVEGALRIIPAASALPLGNGHMVFELTSNTQLTVKVKGSDGVVRSAVLTLA